MLLLLTAKVGDLYLDLSYFLALFLFILSGILYVFVALAHLLFELGYFVDLVIGHPEGGPVVTGLLEDLGDELLALLDELLLTIVGALKSLVDLLVLLPELLQVLSFQVVIEELFEF